MIHQLTNSFSKFEYEISTIDGCPVEFFSQVSSTATRSQSLWCNIYMMINLNTFAENHISFFHWSTNKVHHYFKRPRRYDKKDLCILDQISVLLFYYSTVISFVSENFFFFVKYTARKIRKGVFSLTSFFWYIFVSNSFVAMAVREFSFSFSCWMEITLMLFTTKGNFFL